MKPTARTTRRLSAVAAVAGAAVLLPAVALASSASTGAPAAKSPTVKSAVHDCSASQLTVWVGAPGRGNLGTTGYPLEISNVSKHACTLYGYPRVSALKTGDKQLGRAASDAPGYKKRTVTLGPLGTSYATLMIVDAVNYPPSDCHPTSAIGLKVYPPGVRFPTLLVPLPFEGCASVTTHQISVSPMIPGTGIPGQLAGSGSGA